ncbi:RidA family protein [Roseivirga misakiensis]|uniref:Uncharacterized protein n=1 Tax=Roseivirga misakiensis TaxID=1563681 RepID=A0A1E5T5K9_9BACT|nr:RidA family protein [Roseivirga misakiensis]OEK06661.1 hypothetical protein BFP71_03070 [Roseivirga misakiensis]
MRLKLLISSVIVAFFCLTACEAPDNNQEQQKEEVARFERESSSILKGVKVPEGKSLYLASGIVATEKDSSKPVGDRGRFGDTYDQSVSALKRIESYLSEEGLSLKDVVSMKVYVAPDPENDGKPDFQAWFKAYGEYFGTDNNPNKVARSTIGVYTLVDPNKFIEIEVRAVYP